MSESMYAFVCMNAVSTLARKGCQGLWNCELPNVGAGSRAQIFWKRSTYS